MALVLSFQTRSLICHDYSSSGVGMFNFMGVCAAWSTFNDKIPRELCFHPFRWISPAVLWCHTLISLRKKFSSCSRPVTRIPPCVYGQSQKWRVASRLAAHSCSRNDFVPLSCALHQNGKHICNFQMTARTSANDVWESRRMLLCFSMRSWLRRETLNRAKPGSVTLSDSWNIATWHRRVFFRIL